MRCRKATERDAVDIVRARRTCALNGISARPTSRTSQYQRKSVTRWTRGTAVRPADMRAQRELARGLALLGARRPRARRTDLLGCSQEVVDAARGTSMNSRRCGCVAGPCRNRARTRADVYDRGQNAVAQ